MTAAERLVALAGSTGTAAALLLLLASGATAGEALTAYSGLDGETAAVHLLTDILVPEDDEEDTDSIGGFFGPEPRLMLDPRPRRRRLEEEVLALCGLC